MNWKNVRMSSVLTLIAIAFLWSCAPSPNSNKLDEDMNIELSELQKLDALIEKDSTNASLYEQRARLYLEEGLTNKALSDVGKGIQIDDTDPALYLTLADIYLMMGQLNNSLESLQKVESLAPENTDGLLKQSEIYLILREYGKTHEYIKRALDIDSYNPLAFFIGGYARLEQGDTLKAVMSFVKATELDQNYYDAFMQLGHLYALKNDVLAAGYFQNAINAQPNNPNPYFELGFFLQERGELDMATEYYNRTLQLDPDYTHAYYNLGYLNLVYTGEYQVAINYFSEAIDRQPDFFEAWYNRGYCYELLGEKEVARTNYKRVLELQPSWPKVVEALNRLDNNL